MKWSKKELQLNKLSVTVQFSVAFFIQVKAELVPSSSLSILLVPNPWICEQNHQKLPKCSSDSMYSVKTKLNFTKTLVGHLYPTQTSLTHRSKVFISLFGFLCSFAMKTKPDQIEKKDKDRLSNKVHLLCTLYSSLCLFSVIASEESIKTLFVQCNHNGRKYKNVACSV